MSDVRTRFAPSPTGYLHVGGVRTALFAWLVARQAKGQFILRIEDTDRDRHVEESEQHIIDSLGWLGIESDEPVQRQSERLEVYKEWANKLIASGRAYADYYTSDQLNLMRQNAKDAKKPFLFRDYRPDNPPAWEPGMPLRFRSEPKAYTWEDAVLGDLSAGTEAVDDFIIIKSDGYPTYNFAHIVDDHLMEITHVIRSQEFLSSVPKFLNLYEALDIEFPIFATLPYVMGPDGKKKLSKRDGARDILDYRREGYLPEALVSFLATLGWNDGTEQEIFTVDELIEKFSLSRVQHGGARFDEKRLQWINGKIIRSLDINTLLEKATDFWPVSAEGSALYFRREVLRAIQDKLRSLTDITDLSDTAFNEDYKLDEKMLLSSAGNLGNPEDVLTTVKTTLEKSDFTPEDLEKRLRDLCKELGAKPGDLFGLIRVAITGKDIAPGLWNLLSVIKKDKAMARLDKALATLEK